jgi:hypothetical protein
MGHPRPVAYFKLRLPGKGGLSVERLYRILKDMERRLGEDRAHFHGLESTQRGWFYLELFYDDASDAFEKALRAEGLQVLRFRRCPDDAVLAVLSRVQEVMILGALVSLSTFRYYMNSQYSLN